MNNIIYIVLLLMLASVSGRAQSDFYFKSYVKYLFSHTKSDLVDELLNDHLIHSRVNTKWYANDNVTAALELRLRAFYGGSVEEIPDYGDMIRSDHEFNQLDWFMWEGGSSIGYAQIDRLWVDYYSGDFQATLGRQRIAWGTAWVWNVVDLFNPLSKLDFDYEEKPAADAVRLQYYTGMVTKLEFSYKPGKNKYRTIAAGLWSINKWDYDFNFIGGIKGNRFLGAFAWAGDIAGGGFRGEMILSQPPLLTQPQRPIQTQLFGKSLFHYDEPVFSAVLSGDYTFPSSLYIHTEVMYNSIGKKENAGAFRYEAAELGMLSAARLLFYHEFAYQITPLMRGTLYGMYNPDDNSYIISPSLDWSVLTNLDLTVIGFFAEGKDYSEFGYFGTSGFLRLKYSF